MKVGTPRKGEPDKIGLNPWVVFFITAPIPLLLFVLFIYKWQQQSTDFDRVKESFLDRQNNTLAHEALGIAARIRGLLTESAEDVRTLSLLSPTADSYKAFYASHHMPVTSYTEKNDSITQSALPTYSEISFVDLAGQERVRLTNGQTNPGLRSVQTCTTKNLCDATLWKSAMKLQPGELRFGQVMRWYSREGSPDNVEGANLSVAYRAKGGVYILGLDYRHLRDVLYMPTFPYIKKKNLYQSYLDGNYIYFTDSDLNFIVHPKYWHVTGIDKETGQRVPAVVDDSQVGERPLNISAYRGEKLGDYFKRLLNVSFTQKSVDIFKAPNLTETIRVLSVAPIVFNEGQYKESGIFGYVLTGCNAEFFQEPKERYQPYY